MKNRKIIAVLTVVVIAVGVIFSYKYNIPANKAERFVKNNGAVIEQMIADGEDVSDFEGVIDYDVHSDNTVHEFMLSGFGLAPSSRYYGCYYSVNDTPAVFGGEDLDLSLAGENLWSWQGKGDNHGTTCRIAENWFYFEAAF